MHIFRNVACSIWNHMIATQDSLGIIQDLQNIRRMREASTQERSNGHVLLPTVTWTLIKKDIVEVKQAITSFHNPTRCKKRHATSVGIEISGPAQDAQVYRNFNGSFFLS